MQDLIGVGKNYARIREFPGQGTMKLYLFPNLEPFGSSQQRPTEVHHHGLAVACKSSGLNLDANVNRHTRAAAKISATIAV